MSTGAYTNLLNEISAKIHSGNIALLLMRVSSMARINRQHGYAGGDQMLANIMERVRGVAREQDVFCPLAGNRAALLLTGIVSEGQAKLAAQKLLRKIRLPFEVGGATVALEANIGIGMTSARICTPSRLVANAGLALAAARNINSEYEVAVLDDPSTGALQRILPFDVSDALDKNELLVFFQPILNLVTGKMVGAEALVRWNHPERGMIAPDNFLPGVDSAADMQKLTSYVIGASCRTLASWHEDGKELWVAVNVTAYDLQQPDFAQLLRDTVALWNVDPSHLVIEITESILLTDPAACRKLLEELHEIGVRIAIDDFGTGYSSLAYLRDLCADELKIDRSFIRNIKSSSKDRKIIQSIVQLGKALNMQVVAEGLEDMVSAKLARSLGCDLGQGYLFGRPAATLPDLPCAAGDDAERVIEDQREVGSRN